MDASHAAACGDLDEAAPPDLCVAGGLAAVDLDGSWTFAGTFVDYDGFRRDFTVPAMLARTGSGYCGFSLSYSLSFDMNRSFAFTSAGDLTTYVDDTVARADTNIVCANGSGAVQLSYAASMSGPEGIEHRSIAGTLTR